MDNTGFALGRTDQIPKAKQALGGLGGGEQTKFSPTGPEYV